ncbi:polygalacturonase-like [Amborella trichopoda]|uniref:polygalacturonase-like n=1 Tax=Amborella trichopoda TaxID=13333 RepID=UPI0009BD4D45|nr:polygalacturonase-like [Amborella trichopoda]|eukprot:XP_020529669.1 polygalacturonase-like [Amborella trichopoda]
MRIWCWIFAFACGAAASAAVAKSPPHGVFNVKEYGAVADGKSDTAQAFLGAWKDACAWKGRSRMVIPEGSFLVGPDEFEGQCPNASPIVVQSIKFYSMTNMTLRRISSIDSKFFHIAMHGCKNVKAHHLRISARANSPNTDGIHISSSTGIKIARSQIGTGDDCISIGPGSHDIFIKNIFCGPGHGISLGKYQNEEDVSGLKVRNCTISNTTNGMRIKTWPGSTSSSATNFTFNDVIMNNGLNPIIIDQD